MVCSLRILIAFVFAVGTLLTADFARAKTARDCAKGFQTLAEARASLENKVASNLANPPTHEIRILKPEEVTVKPMSGGEAFNFKYTNDDVVSLYWRPGKSIGNEITFVNSKGRDHKIVVVGRSRNPEGLKSLTEMVLRLPADTLESVERIELQTFVKNSRTDGYAETRRFILHEGGDNERTVRHEFGHNLAEKIWGRMYPYREWEKAFNGDGGRYATPYAKSSAASTQFSEDFAESVADYLGNTVYFRSRFPNRAALLDTVFRGGGVSIADSPFAAGGTWQQISDNYGTALSRVVRWAEQRPVTVLSATTGVAVVSGAAGYGLVYFVGKCREGECPRPSPSSLKSR